MRIAAAALIVAVFAAAYVFARTRSHEVQFDASRWRANPATERWAVDNLRYQMRTGAAVAARACPTGDDVVALLGNPDGSGDYSKPSDDDAPAFSHLYDLGMLRQPIEFWEMRARVQLIVVMNRRNRVISAAVEEVPRVD